MSRVARVGLTGGIGSGKSTAANMFSEFGIPVLDLDDVGKRLAAQPDHLAMLVNTFGDRILCGDGSLDRHELARICFSDAKKTKRLNRIMHPPIWEAAEAWIDRQHACYALIEASVLIESGGVSRMDDVVAVVAGESIRRERVLASRDMNAAYFDAVVQRQCNDLTRHETADYMIKNDADLPSLRAKVEILHHLLMKKYPPDIIEESISLHAGYKP